MSPTEETLGIFERRPRAEVTLENPAESAGAEGARRKPNLSGKRTEQTK